MKEHLQRVQDSNWKTFHETSLKQALKKALQVNRTTQISASKPERDLKISLSHINDKRHSLKLFETYVEYIKNNRT